MNTLKDSLSAAGIEANDLSRLTTTDLGDVLFYTADGGGEAINQWKQLRQLIPQTNHWPVLLGPPDEIERHQEMVELNSDPVAVTLKHAETIDFPDWFSKKLGERLEELREYNPGEDEADFLAPLGEWPKDAEPSNKFLTPFDISTREPLDRIAIALVPTIKPWEVPAYLRLGSWNECPEAAAHCAVQKYWHHRHGAEIVAATHDVIEMTVTRPPRSRDAAIELARQQYAYCADIVEQGTQNLANLAAALLDGSAWFFWWD